MAIDSADEKAESMEMISVEKLAGKMDFLTVVVLAFWRDIKKVAMRGNVSVGQ